MQSDIHVISNKILKAKHGHEIPRLLPKAAAAHSVYTSWPMRAAFTPTPIIVYSAWRHYRGGTKIPKLPDDYDVHRDGWVFGGGGPCALQVAASYGFERVVFIGLDLYTDKDHHFYSSESKSGTEISECSGYSRDKLNKAWIIQREYFRQTIAMGEWEGRGIEVLNVGRYDGFRRVEFEEVF